MNGLKRSSWKVTLGIAAVAVAYPMLVFIPRMAALAHVRSQVREKQDFVAQAERLRPTLKLIDRDLDETGAYGTRWQERMGSARELATLFGQISQLAKACGTDTTRFEPLPAVELQTLQKVQVNFGLSGSFVAIARLLHDMERLSATIWVEDLKLEAAREVGGPAKCEMKLVVFVNKSEKSD
jgi:Tfp pilus assembly protein PilO